MTTKAPVNTPYLRNQRQFPTENPQALQVELDKTYIDVSLAVNNRTIGLFPVTQMATTGETWYLKGPNQRQQGQRQVYTFTATGNLPHNLPSAISTIIRGFGTYTDGTNTYGLIFGSNTTIAGQVSFYVTPSVGTTSGNIVIAAGAGAPSITSGVVVLEWLANV